MKPIFLISVLMLAAAPACAQTIDTSPEGNVPAIINAVPSDAVAMPAHKSVRDMTDEERQQFWSNLPQADKDRVLAKREQMEQDAAKKAHWKDLTSTTPRTMVPDSQPVAPAAEAGTATPALEQSLANGKAQWDAMSPEEKRAFVEAHKSEIMNAIQDRQNNQ